MTTPLFSATAASVFGEGATHREIYAERREKFRRDAHDFYLLGRTRFADDFGAARR